MSSVIVQHPAPAIAEKRRRLEQAIENAIAALDALDGSPDLEDGGDDEPSLSAAIPSMRWDGTQAMWLYMAEDDDREDAPEDFEPSLCGVTFGRGCERDLEAQCEDEGIDTDREPEVAL